MADTAKPFAMLEAGFSPLSISPIALAAQIVSAFVGNNPVRADDIPGLVATTHAAIVKAAVTPELAEQPAELAVEKPTPAQIRKSITHDGLVSFIDGKTYKTLKRHLTKHGIEPRTYRERYGLPVDYPMTAPSYSEARSNLAKSIGLGRPGGMTEQPVQQAQAQAAGTTAVRRSKTAA